MQRILSLSLCFIVSVTMTVFADSLPNELPKWTLERLNVSEDGLSARCGERLTDDDMAWLRAFPKLEKLNITACSRITAKGLAHLKDLPNLKDLMLRWEEPDLQELVDVLRPAESVEKLAMIWGKATARRYVKSPTGDDVKRLRDLPPLYHLQLNDCRGLADDNLAALCDLPELETLTLGLEEADALTDRGLAHCRNLPKLHTLSIYLSKQLTDACFASLADVPQLRTLRIIDCEAITGTGLEKLASLETLWVGSCPSFVCVAAMPQLVNLKLTSCKSLTGEGLQPLREMPALRSLEIDGCNKLGDDALPAIGSLANLHVLRLKSMASWKGEPLAHFEMLTQLRVLELNNVWGTAAGMVALRNMTQLRELHMPAFGIQVHESGLTHLAMLYDLETLVLPHSMNVTDAGVGCLANLRQLQTLEIAGDSSFTGEGFATLSGLTRLQTLKVRGFLTFPDDGLEHIQNMTNLRTMDLYGYWGFITDATEKKLKESLPDCKVDIHAFPPRGIEINWGYRAKITTTNVLS